MSLNVGLHNVDVEITRADGAKYILNTTVYLRNKGRIPLAQPTRTVTATPMTWKYVVPVVLDFVSVETGSTVDTIALSNQLPTVLDHVSTETGSSVSVDTLSKQLANALDFVSSEVGSTVEVINATKAPPVNLDFAGSSAGSSVSAIGVSKGSSVSLDFAPTLSGSTVSELAAVTQLANSLDFVSVETGSSVEVIALDANNSALPVVLDFNASTSGSTVDTLPISVATPDTTIPVITLNGLTTNYVTIGSSFTDLGAVWVDNIDGTGQVVAVSGDTVDTQTAGTYILNYDFTDSSGNHALRKSRIVVVREGAPQIEILAIVKSNHIYLPHLSTSLKLGTWNKY